MIHKTRFDQSTIDCIENLIRLKNRADTETQKSIRNKIRNLGFYWTDFHPKDEYPQVEYNVENFRQLIKCGLITVNGKNNRMCYTHETKEDKRSSPQPSNNYKESLEPWVGKDPKVLILGTMPGDESLKQRAYYCSPNNPFWKIMRTIFGSTQNDRYTSNKEFITSKGIALWDCIKNGIRSGSLDSGFNEKTLIGNDIQGFLNSYPTIRTIILNGKGKTLDYFNKYCNVTSDITVIPLNSTVSYIPTKEKIQIWSILKKLV